MCLAALPGFKWDAIADETIQVGDRPSVYFEKRPFILRNVRLFRERPFICLLRIESRRPLLASLAAIPDFKGDAIKDEMIQVSAERRVYLLERFSQLKGKDEITANNRPQRPWAS